MPISDVWMTPSRLATPLWWKLSSGIVITVVTAWSKILFGVLNKTTIDNQKALHDLLDNKPDDKPLITACNHTSCIDDNLLAHMVRWKHVLNTEKVRWIPAAKEICFNSRSASLFMQLGRTLPVVRGDGVYQHTMNFLTGELNTGGWVHIYPEGKVNLTKEFMRLKWGVGRLVADSKVCPIVLPYWHIGMDSVLPNTKPYIPQTGKKVTVTIGDPMDFEKDLSRLRQNKKSDVEIRKFITDKIQDEFKRLKAITERRHSSWS